MEDKELEKHFFRPICNQSEIERIFNVQNSNDYLLKLRAETIIDHMRLFRVYRNKALMNEDNWSLETSFINSHYSNVLNKMPLAEKERCNTVFYGDIFSNDPNGMIFRTDFGPITTISESLKFFLKFSHLALLNFSQDIPIYVRINSLRIAIRVMLKTEALDFFMDPRGILPEEINQKIHAPIQLQLQFIAGHEFAHFLLNHLSESDTALQPIFFAISNKETDFKLMPIYNTSQKQEFEADVNSIMLPEYGKEERCELLEAALLWFGCLELYELVSDTIYPQWSGSYKSHPTAQERYENLLLNIPTPKGFDVKKWRQFPSQLIELKKWLQEDISLNWETYEMYGSAYLDNPNTKWRGKELVDRQDYY